LQGMAMEQTAAHENPDAAPAVFADTIVVKA
jgi:hypothetical protein